MARAKQPVHSFLGGKAAVIQQGVWVGSPKSTIYSLPCERASMPVVAVKKADYGEAIIMS
jgi:hypothetical protein